jgi:hypothetical protein
MLTIYNVVAEAIEASADAYRQDYLNFYALSDREPAPPLLNQSALESTGKSSPAALTVTCNVEARRPRGQVPLRSFPVVPPWSYTSMIFSFVLGRAAIARWVV